MYLVQYFNKLLMSANKSYRDVIRNMCFPVSNYPKDVPDELLKCLQFDGDNETGSKFEDYLGHNKILVDDTLFEQYTNIFMSNNYIRSSNTKRKLNDYTFYDCRVVCGEIIMNYIAILRNNGYMPNIVCLLKYPRLVISIDDIYIQKEHKETVKCFLYNNIIEITQYKYLVQKLNNDDLNVIYELSHNIYKIKDLEKIYRDNPGTKPNKIHLIIGIRNCTGKLSVAKMFVNFYAKHGVKCRQLSVYACSSHMTYKSRLKLIHECRVLGLFDDPVKIEKNGGDDPVKIKKNGGYNLVKIKKNSGYNLVKIKKNGDDSDNTEDTEESDNTEDSDDSDDSEDSEDSS